jgi:hypothetical protein
MKRHSVFEAPPGPTPTEISQRFPTTVPERLSLPVGKWLLRGEAVAALQAGNGTDDPVVASCWLTAMVRSGLVDIRDGDGLFRLLPVEERIGFAPAEARRVRLEALRRDIAALEGEEQS